ncbi:hypothetical protein BHM03_00019830 [Ensete ventricosum]|nr:hypothetical protein BHM03_00019830 [Ensete ventricosum]
MKSPVNPVKVEVMEMRSPAVTSQGGSVDDDIDLFLHWAFWMERRLVQLPWITTKVSSTDEVFNLVLQVVTLLDVVAVIMVDAVVMPSALLLWSGLHWVRSSEEAFLLDLEEDLSSG